MNAQTPATGPVAGQRPLACSPSPRGAPSHRIVLPRVSDLRALRGHLPGATRGLCLFLFLLFSAVNAAACPLCKEAVQSNPKLTEGFARSIHLLMSMPYLLFGGLTLTIVLSARRKKG